MYLSGVTLTGADDSVSPQDLLDISDDYSFVEWGILAGNRFGVPRMPSERWLTELGDLLSNVAKPAICSLHICGRYLEDLKNGLGFPSNDAIRSIPWMRSQINFHGQELKVAQIHGIMKSLQGDRIGFEVIMQLDGVNDSILDVLELSSFPVGSGLYDLSHGKGKTPEVWPKANPNWEVGYAGGLGPDNIKTEIAKIITAAGSQPFWIDMESKLRTEIPGRGDCFDLKKCKEVLETCKSFFANPP